jgi:hypothetical protein
VPFAKSSASIRMVENPREAASTAAPRPVAPPPIMSISHVLFSSNWLNMEFLFMLDIET